MAARHVADLVRDREDARGGRPAADRDGDEPAAVALDDRVEQLLASADVPVDAGRLHTELRGELAHRELVDAVALDDRQRFVDDAFLRDARPAA